jgi:uncharacterized protein
MPPSYYAPDPTASYRAEEVQVQTKEGYHLAGTITTPLNILAPFPAVVLISGSSPSDRDCMSSRDRITKNYRPFFQIADALSRRGLVVLRMDDRGVGCSKGGDIYDATIHDRADDIREGINFLRGLDEIDKTRIGLLGISEGGSIGPIIAASDPSIRALVIMAGTAINGWEILEYQCRYEVNRNRKLSKRERNRICSEKIEYWKKVEKENKRGRHFNYFLNYNPLKIARKVSCPVLILHGNRDAAVPVQNALLLAKVMRENGNEDVTLDILKNYNHLFLKDPDGRISHYVKLLENTNQISDEVLTMIADWFTRRLNPR